MATRGRRGRTPRLAAVGRIAGATHLGPNPAPICGPLLGAAAPQKNKAMMLSVQGSWGGEYAISGT